MIEADTAHSALVTDHAFKRPEDPNRFLCAVCNLAESTHLTTETPYEPKHGK